MREKLWLSIIAGEWISYIMLHLYCARGTHMGPLFRMASDPGGLNWHYAYVQKSAAEEYYVPSAQK